MLKQRHIQSNCKVSFFIIIILGWTTTVGPNLWTQTSWSYTIGPQPNCWSFPIGCCSFTMHCHALFLSHHQRVAFRGSVANLPLEKLKKETHGDKSGSFVNRSKPCHISLCMFSEWPRGQRSFATFHFHLRVIIMHVKMAEITAKALSLTDVWSVFCCLDDVVVIKPGFQHQACKWLGRVCWFTFWANISVLVLCLTYLVSYATYVMLYDVKLYTGELKYHTNV